MMGLWHIRYYRNWWKIIIETI